MLEERRQNTPNTSARKAKSDIIGYTLTLGVSFSPCNPPSCYAHAFHHRQCLTPSPPPQNLASFPHTWTTRFFKDALLAMQRCG